MAPESGAYETVRFALSLPGGPAVSLAAWRREAGRDCLVFLHGLACSKRAFVEAFTMPSLAAHSLLALDLLGFGDSTRSAALRYDLADQASLVTQVLRRLKGYRIHLVGHSLGGTVAALLDPGTLASLASLTLVEGRLVAASSTYSRLVSQIAEATFVSRHFPDWARRGAASPYLAEALRRADPVAVHRSARSLYRWVCEADLPARLAACRALAKTFVYGDRNPDLPERDGPARLTPVVIPGAGHFPMHDNPSAFYAALAQGVARVAAGPPVGEDCS